jgi:hypothetical protein
MDLCPTCREELASRTLGSTSAGQHLELRRCPACRHLAQRTASSCEPWADGGQDPSIDYLFDIQLRPLPDPWSRVSADARTALEAELRAEVSQEHPLFGKPVIAVARREGCDDVLFSVEEDPARFVLVHLTWRQAPEPPPWPRTHDVSPPLADSLALHEH